VTEGLLGRATRRAGREASAVWQAAAFGRAADGVVAAAAMFAAGMAHATPARWGSRVLRRLGVERLRLRPRRLDGYEVTVNPSDSGHTCVIEEFFVPPVAYDLSLVEFDPPVVIDCGAHIGLFTLLARRRFPSAAITAFEPNPNNLRWLRENLRINGRERRRRGSSGGWRRVRAAARFYSRRARAKAAGWSSRASPRG